SCLDAWLSANPDVARYAAFQVARERLGRSWQEWPEHARRGNLEDVQRSDEEEVRVREFAQRLADAQLMNCVEQAEANGAGLYLDLPIGIHQEGYDTWRYHGEFVEGVAAGAPPDTVFTSGQTWGSPPLHPAAIRARHYDYVRAYLAHHMRVARMLRIDHVMGLHRIFCIPEGAPPAMGAYLRYRPEEWYAILSIESHRHKTVLVGEDLGLVPAQVRRSMTRHRLNRMYVLHYELDGIAAGRSPSLPTRSLASLNTHDMPSFAAMWRGLDICQHARVGLVRPEQVPVLKASRSRAIQILVHVLRSVCPELDERQDLDVVLRCTLRWLGSRGPKYVVVSVEDLWHETIQQNIPGVGDAYPSWRHRATMTLKEAWRVPEVQAALTELKVVMGAGGPGARREQK
ncbi:MAG: 4-alpha-glucanotransferase, partial [Dehalococcoidia bacterium]|nr:4-alpha-glucanotransferase [Dehalococcoidia bacterium]